MNKEPEFKELGTVAGVQLKARRFEGDFIEIRGQLALPGGLLLAAVERVPRHISMPLKHMVRMVVRRLYDDYIARSMQHQGKDVVYELDGI